MGYPDLDAFYSHEPRAEHISPGRGPADEIVVVFEARGSSIPYNCWLVLFVLETGQVYGVRIRRGCVWRANRPGAGVPVDGPVRVLGCARNRKALDEPVHGDPVGFLTGRVGGVDSVADRLAGSTWPPPP